MGIVNLAGTYALVVSKYKIPMLSKKKGYWHTAEKNSAEKKRAINDRHIISYTVTIGEISHLD